MLLCELSRSLHATLGDVGQPVYLKATCRFVVVSHIVVGAVKDDGVRKVSEEGIICVQILVVGPPRWGCRGVIFEVPVPRMWASTRL